MKRLFGVEHYGGGGLLDFNLRCFTFSLCSQVFITFLILFIEVLIFLTGANEFKDKACYYHILRNL